MRPNHERLNNSSNENLDDAIDEALEGSLRAEKWADYVAALQVRQDRIQRDLQMTHDNAERTLLQSKLDEIDEQIQVLREEENITKFVEDAVTFSYEVHRLSEG